MANESGALPLFLAFFLGVFGGVILTWVFLMVVPTFLSIRQARLKANRLKIAQESELLDIELKRWGAAKALLIKERESSSDNEQNFSGSLEVENAIDKERLRIAHELHDDIVQRMAAVRLRMEEFSYRLDKPELIEGLSALNEEMNQIMKSLRFVIYGLPQPQFEQNSFSSLIKDFLVARLNHVAGKTVELQLENEQQEFFLPGPVKRELYNLMQEAVQNSLKHSAGFHLKLSMAWDTILEIEVIDNGQGYLPQAGAASGLGFVSMEERAKAIGATLNLISSTFGSIVRITVPDHFSK
jgi:signal transduction histidine kinase